MQVMFCFDLDRFLMVGYILAVSCLNFTMYLISAFYKKKFDQDSPKIGFIIGIALALCYALSVFVSIQNVNKLQLIQSVLLILSGCASCAGSIGLFLTMRKVRK